MDLPPTSSYKFEIINKTRTQTQGCPTFMRLLRITNGLSLELLTIGVKRIFIVPYYEMLNFIKLTSVDGDKTRIEVGILMGLLDGLPES